MEASDDALLDIMLIGRRVVEKDPEGSLLFSEYSDKEDKLSFVYNGNSTSISTNIYNILEVSSADFSLAMLQGVVAHYLANNQGLHMLDVVDVMIDTMSNPESDQEDIPIYGIESEEDGEADGDYEDEEDDY